MQATLEKAFGYQGDNMNLPVPDLAAAIPFYETVLGFQVSSRSDAPHKSAGTDARPGSDRARGKRRRSLAERVCLPREGPGVVVRGVHCHGLHKEHSNFDVERRDGVAWNVFYVIAPDGLCYWFGERQPG